MAFCYKSSGTFPSAVSKLEHGAISFPELQSERIVSLHVSSLYTLARLQSGALYWWGVMPFTQVRIVSGAGLILDIIRPSLTGSLRTFWLGPRGKQRAW